MQGDITPAQEAFCYWITFSKKYRECNFDATSLVNILKTLEQKWLDGYLSGEEVSYIKYIFSALTTVYLASLNNICLYMELSAS